MEQTTERPEILQGHENHRYPTIEEERAEHPNYDDIGNFADDGKKDPAVRAEITALILNNLKNRAWVSGMWCYDTARQEMRYILFAERSVETNLDNVIGGVALGMPRPHRY